MDNVLCSTRQWLLYWVCVTCEEGRSVSAGYGLTKGAAMRHALEHRRHTCMVAPDGITRLFVPGFEWMTIPANIAHALCDHANIPRMEDE